MANPTNADLIKLITVNHEEVKNRLTGVEEQVRTTNGQVRVLNEWKAAVTAVDDYKKAAIGSSTDWTKIVLACLGIVATALAIVSQVVAK